MTEDSLRRKERSADRLLLGRSHPVLALCLFLATFVLAAFPFALGTDNAVSISASVTACATAAIQFIRLVIGKLGFVKYLLLIAPAILLFTAFIAGAEWHFVLIITGGVIVCSYALSILIGDFRPLIRDVGHFPSDSPDATNSIAE